MPDTKVEAARELAWSLFNSGWRPQNLLSRGNMKLMKAERNIGLSLAPADVSGFQVCASSSPQCRIHCIHTSGHGTPNFHSPEVPCNPVWVARIFKTIWFFKKREEFMLELYRDIARNRDSRIRLNVFSDWQWERQHIEVPRYLALKYNTHWGFFHSLMDVFPDTQFYDYTKHFARMFRDRPKNYHLTFSLTENNQDQARKVLEAGMNVAAIVTHKHGTLFGYPILDGDENDLRFLDPPGHIVGLKPKGSLRNQSTEFVYVPEVFQGAAPAPA